MGDAERLEKTADSLARCVRTLNIHSNDLANLRQDIVHRRPLRPYETAAMRGAPTSDRARKLRARDVQTCMNLMQRLAGTASHVKDSDDLWRRVGQLVSSPAPPSDLLRPAEPPPEPPSAGEPPGSGEVAAEETAEADAGSAPAHPGGGEEPLAQPVGESGPRADGGGPHAPAAGAHQTAPRSVPGSVKELADCIRILEVPEGHLLALQNDVDLGNPLGRYAVTALREAHPSAAKIKVVGDCLELLRSARVKRRPDLWRRAAEERKVMELADCIRTLRVQPNHLSDLRHDVERGRSLEAFRAVAMRGALRSGAKGRLRAKAVGDCLTKLQTQFAHAHGDMWEKAGRLAFPAPTHPAPPPPPPSDPAPDDVDEPPPPPDEDPPPPPGAALSTAQALKRESASLQATLKWKPPTVPVLSAPPPQREGALATFRHPWPHVHGRRPASSWTAGATHENLPHAVAVDICRAAGRAVHLEGWASFKARMGRTSHLIAGISNEMRVVEEGVYFPPGVLAETAAWRFLRRSAPQDPLTHPLATEEIHYVAHRVDDRAMGQRSLEAFALRFVQGTLLFHELGQCFLAPLVVGWGFEHAPRTSRPHVVGDAPRKILEEPFAKGGDRDRKKCSRAEDCVGALCELSGKQIVRKEDAVCANERCYLRDVLRAHCASQAGRPFLRASAPAAPLTGSRDHESWSERLGGNAAELISSILREDATKKKRGPYPHRNEGADDRAEQDKVAGRRQREEPVSDEMEAALLAALQSDDDDVEERSEGSELDAHAVAAAGDPAAERGDKPEAIVQELRTRSRGRPDQVLRRLGVVAHDEASVPDEDDPERERLEAELAELPLPRPHGAQPLSLADARARAYRFRKFLRHAATARAARSIDREKDAAILHALGARSTPALKNALVASWADRRRGRTDEEKSMRIVREARRAGGSFEADDPAPPPVHAGIGRALGIVLRRGHQRHETPIGTHDGLLGSGEVAAFLRREKGRNPPWELLPAPESARVCRLPDGSWYRPEDESLLGRGPVGARGDGNRPRREPAGARDDDSQTSDEAPWEPPDFLSEASEEELPEGEMATDELRGWRLLASTHHISLAHDLFLRSLREHAVAVPPAAFAHAVARTVIHLAAAGVFFLGLSATDFSWTESRERVVLSRTDLPFALRWETVGTDTWDVMAALCMLDSIFLRAYLDWRYLIAELVTHAQPGAAAPAKQTPDAARLLVATRALLTSGMPREQATAIFRDRVMQDLRPTPGVNGEQRDGGQFFTVLGSQILGTWEEGAHKISAAMRTGAPEGAVRLWNMHRRDRDRAIHAWKRRMQSVVDRDAGVRGEIPAWVLPVDTDHETEPNLSSRMLVRWRPGGTQVAESHRFGEEPPLPRDEEHRYPGIVTLELTPSQGEKKTRPRREGHDAGEEDSSSGSSEPEDGEKARRVTSEGDIRTLAYEVRALLRRQVRLPGEKTPFITLPGGERRAPAPRDWLGTPHASDRTRGGGKFPEPPTLRWRPWRMAAPVQLSLNLILHVAHELYAPGSGAMESLLRHEMPWPEPALPSLALSPFDAEHSQDGCRVEACASSGVWHGTVPRVCVALPAHPRDSTCLRPGWALRAFVLYLPIPAEASRQRSQEDVPPPPPGDAPLGEESPPPPPPRAVGQGRHYLLQGFAYVSPEQLPSALPVAAPPPTVSAADAGGRGLLAATRRAFVAQVIMLDLLFLLHASSESLSAGTLARGQRVVVVHPDLAARDGAPDQEATVVEALPGAAGLGRRYRVRLELTTAARELELSAMIRRAHLADRGHPADAFKERRDAIVFRSALREDPRGAAAAKQALDHFLERRTDELEDLAQGERRPSASGASILAAVVQGRSPEVLAPFCAAAASSYAETMETLRAAASTAAQPSDSPTAGAARELATFLRHPVLTFDHATAPQDLPLFLSWASRLFGPTWQRF